MGPLLHLSAADRMSAMSNPINSTQTLPVKQHSLPIRTRNVVKNSLISWQYSHKQCYENPLNHGFTKTTWIIQMHELNRAHTHFNIIPNVPSCPRQCSSGLPMNTLYTCLSSPIHATCPTNLSSVQIFTLTMQQSQCSVTSKHFLTTLSLCSALLWQNSRPKKLCHILSLPYFDLPS